MWTQTYKEYLETLMNATEKTVAAIKDYREYHTDTTVHFTITLTDEQMVAALEGGDLCKKFKLESSISTSNMVLFDPKGRIKKYDNVEDILTEFYQLRLKTYQERKVSPMSKLVMTFTNHICLQRYLSEKLTDEWSKLENKVCI